MKIETPSPCFMQLKTHVPSRVMLMEAVTSVELRRFQFDVDCGTRFAVGDCRLVIFFIFMLF